MVGISHAVIVPVKLLLADGVVITEEIETNYGKWYQVMTMPYIRQADNKRDGAILTFNDITELKSIQQELNGSNMILGMAIDSTEMGTWTIDVQTLAFIPSNRLKVMFGFRNDEDMPYEAAIAQILPEYRDLVTNAVKAAIDGIEKYDVEYPLHGLHDGKLRWVRGIGNLAYNKDGKPRYFTGLLLDVTIHKQHEIRKNDFIAMVSHELRTPITCMQGYLQLLMLKAKKTEDTFAVGTLDKTHNQVKKMSALINGFLNASSFEAGKIYLNEEVFAIDVLINEIVEEIMLTTNKHHIVLKPSSCVNIKADRDKIGQVINNFLSNAVKYSPKGGTIELDCKESDGMLQVSVKDEGMGIKPDDQEKLFDRYYRIESVNTSNISGFGLGLYLSAEIIQRHDGKVWVESEIGKGSTFYFSLPSVA